MLFILILAAFFYFKGPAENHGTVRIPAGQVTEPSEQSASINHGSDSTKTVEYEGNDFTARKMLAFAYYKMDDLDKSLHNIEIGLSMKSDPQLQFLHDKIKREHRTQQKFIDESTRHFKVIFDGHENGAFS